MHTEISLPTGRAALVCIDMQEEHRRDQHVLAVGYDNVISNVAQLQAAARVAGVPVYHFAYIVDIYADTTRAFHPKTADGRSAFSDKDDPNSAICPEVAPVGDEPLVIKTEASAFGAGLGDDLNRLGIQWLIICGVWTEACVDATVKDALKRDLHVMLVKDACGSGSIAMHQVGILNMANRLYGGVVVTTKSACEAILGKTVLGWTPARPVPLRYETADVETLYASL